MISEIPFEGRAFQKCGVVCECRAFIECLNVKGHGFVFIWKSQGSICDSLYTFNTPPDTHLSKILNLESKSFVVISYKFK